MNEPVVEVTDEAAKAIFLAAAVIILAIWIVPYLGSAQPVAAATGEPMAQNYEPVFGQYQQVAGATVGGESRELVSPKWFLALADAGEGLGDMYQETFEKPFAEATVQTLDISQPMGSLLAYYQPGLDAVWNAWLELMADPAY